MRLKLQLIITLAIVSAGVGHAADRVGNGGSFDEREVITLAYENLDALKALRKAGGLDQSVDLERYSEKLKTLRVKFVDSAEVSGMPKSAVNYPDENLIEIVKSDWSSHPQRAERLPIVLHEVLWLIGIHDTAYLVSIPLFTKLRPHLDKKSGNLNASPVLLYSAAADDVNEGMSGWRAARDCSLQKEIHKGEYFFIYCIYYEKHWDSTQYETFNDSSSTYLKDWTGEVFRTHEDYWKSLPVTKTEIVYGLRVFGLGLMEELPWQVIGSSVGLVDGMIDLTFPTAREAYRTCIERLKAEGRDSLRFYLATCRAVKNDDGTYFYQIITKNPLVNGKE